MHTLAEVLRVLVLVLKVLGEDGEEVSFSLPTLELSVSLGLSVGVTDRPLVQYELVEPLCEVDGCFIEHMHGLLHTDDMLGLAFGEDLAYELGLTGGYED